MAPTVAARDGAIQGEPLEFFLSAQSPAVERVATAHELRYSRTTTQLPSPAVCTFGLFEFDTATGELRRVGRVVRLAPQPTRLLVALVASAGRVVTRDELKELVWGGDTYVDFEQGLSFCVKQVRAALGDDADNPRFIETVPRRGYRLIAPVEWTEKTPARSSRPATWIVIAAVAILAGVGYLAWWPGRSIAIGGNLPKTMVAVLPFENLSGDPDQEFFSDGFTEELIGQLGRIDPARLGVIARTSTVGYRGGTKSAAEIGRELNVQHLVEGSVRRSGNTVRINAQLIRVADQSHVWAEIYEGDVKDILAMQYEVGTAVARQIVRTLGPAAGMSPRVVDPAVYDLYLRGRFLWNRRTQAKLETAAGNFQEAVRRDPTFAPAYAGLADALLVGSRPAALTAAERALAIDDRLAEAHSAKAHALMHMFRWREAEESFRRAIALDPNYVPAHYFYAEYLVVRGRGREAVAEAQRGLALDPVSAIATHVTGVMYYFAGEFDRALPFFQKALELDPEHTWSHGRIALVLERRRDYPGAIAEFELNKQPLRAAYTYAMAGRQSEARRIMENVQAHTELGFSAYHLGGAYVGLREYDKALKWLAVAVERQEYDVVYLYVDPRLEPLRERPEFQALLRSGGWTN